MLHNALIALSRRLPRMTALLIGFCLLTASLAGCKTAGTVVAPQVAIDFACQTYGAAGTYDTSRDTKQTVKGVKNKNARFGNIGCKL